MRTSSDARLRPKGHTIKAIAVRTKDELDVSFPS